MIWQRLARHLAARWRVGLWFGLFGGARFSLQVFQLQLQLLDLAFQLFGATAKLHALQFGDQQLQVFNLCRAGVELRRQALHLLIARQQHCLQGGNVVGEIGGGQHAPQFTRMLSCLQGRLWAPSSLGPAPVNAFQ